MNNNSDLRYVKKTNALFLSFILLFLAMEAIIAVISIMHVSMGIVPTLFISQGIILIPSLVFIVFEQIEVIEWVPFKKIKWSTFWLTILFTICLSPFISLINVLSQLLTTNIVAELSGEFFSVSPLVIIFIVGFFGPFCEEFTFRGVIYHGLKKSGRILGAILASALFFGLMHMNLNQFSYAFVLGLAFGLINEATGSILPSLIMHILINSFNVGLEYLMDYAFSVFGESTEGLAGAINEIDTGKDEVLFAAGMLLIPALIGLALSIVIFIAICRKEGSLARMRSLFKHGSTPSEVGEKSEALSATVKETELISGSAPGSGPETESLTASETNTPSAESGKCPVITVTGWIAVGICVLVIIASSVVEKLFELL